MALPNCNVSNINVHLHGFGLSSIQGPYAAFYRPGDVISGSIEIDFEEKDQQHLQEHQQQQQHEEHEQGLIPLEMKGTTIVVKLIGRGYLKFGVFKKKENIFCNDVVYFSCENPSPTKNQFSKMFTFKLPNEERYQFLASIN